ncbi:MAG: 30S ribosome-binding factor RbfA [Thermodesulfobacteriota bacterium]
MLGGKRSLRVADMIHKEISEMLIKGEIRDPRVNSVILTGIKISDDLGFARIFFTVMDDNANVEEILAGLQSAATFIKRELSKRFRIKRIPDLRFEFDIQLQEGYRVDELLRKTKSE